MQSDWNRIGARKRWRALGGALAALALCHATGAAGAEPGAPAAAPPPAVELDRLLKLPSDVQIQHQQIGSGTKNQWRSRFTSARSEHDAAAAALEATQKKLGTVAGETDAWQIAAPGAGASAAASEAPIDFQLKQDLRRQREDLARSERHLRELTIEADLAGVPPDWRE
ncbi:MAG TPA: hypothetical protein VII72_17425 [Myxococcota bacterium]